MRRLIFIGFIGLGALIGCISVMNSDWGTRLVMMGVGALFAAPIGGALAGIGKSGRSLGRAKVCYQVMALHRKIWRQTTGATKGIHRL
jgi:hypothetical protein